MYVGVYYIVFIAFTVSVITTYINHGGTYYPDQVFGSFFLLFVLAGVGVLIHIRRLTLALTTKRRALQAGTTVPQYEIDISPVEASILIDAVDEGEVAHLIINSIQDKGDLRAWRDSNGRIQLQNLDSGADLTYYEKTFMAWMFRTSNTVALTDRQLRRHRAAKVTQHVIYEHMISRGYYAKMTFWQRFIYQYAVTTTAVCSYICYIPLVIVMTDQFTGQPLFGPADIILTTQLDLIILLSLWAIVLAITPLVLLLFSAYTKKGSETFRNVYGLYWFLKVAYSSRFTDKEFMSALDYKKYAPYAKAFGFRVEE